MYINPLIRERARRQLNNRRKIRTYLFNGSFCSNNGARNLLADKRQRRTMGLMPSIYNGIMGTGQDDYDWYGYSADPLRDSVKTMADRIILSVANRKFFW